ncbi:MAG: type II secretion system F family protein [Phycisphaerae bacterium]|jgi:general secretion pathway protein F|nr:type II secretion system F family protein [Phycisphaerae bacterium]
MPSFRYQAIDASGSSTTGVLVASDRASAIRQLQVRGETPVAIDLGEAEAAAAAAATRQEVARTTGFSLPRIFARAGRPTLSRSDTANLIRELATALEAGLPLLQALRTVRRQADGEALPAILDYLIERVEAGQPLHNAAREYGPPFDDMIVGMMKAADASGRMAEILHQLADLLERSVELRRELVGATVYPMIVAGLIVVSSTILITFVLPRIMEPILANGRELPIPTRILLGVADTIRTWWFLLLGAIIASVYGWRTWIRNPDNRFQFDGWLLRLPLVGRLLRDVAVARFTRTLGTLVSAGMPILSALRIVRDTLGNTVLMQAIDQVQDKVTTGQSLADPLERCGHFPALLVQIVNIGERSGRLEPMLMHAASAFDRQVSNSIKLFTKSLPPVLLVVMACVAAFVLIAILLPLLEMQSAIGG